MATSEKAFYVSNKKLFEEYVQWFANIKEAEDVGAEEPQIPDFIVDSMMRIATRLSYRPNFIKYTFKDDMISDALYDCVRFAKKFNPDKSDNPFSYITTICFRAFLRRIDKEKTQKYVKAMVVSQYQDGEFFDNQSHEEGSQFTNQYIDFLREVGNSDDSVPMSVKRTKQYQKTQAKRGPLDDFMTDDE